jgi:hypothetical protein
LNTLNQSLGSNNMPRMYDRFKQIGMLMDTYDLVKSKNNNKNDPMDEDTRMQIIEQGNFYYGRKNGLAPKDYLDIVELACLVTGQTTNSYMELAMRDVDTQLQKANRTSTILKGKYDNRYSYTMAAGVSNNE